MTPKPEPPSPTHVPVEVREERNEESNEGDENEEEDGDEETFAVQKVLKHRIGKKQNVTRPLFP